MKSATSLVTSMPADKIENFEIRARQGMFSINIEFNELKVITKNK